jgi:hypothetical protein
MVTLGGIGSGRSNGYEIEGQTGVTGPPQSQEPPAPHLTLNHNLKFVLATCTTYPPDHQSVVI